MKKVTTFLALAFVGFLSLAFSQAPASYKVDPAASSLAWKGEKVTGMHTGFISISEGNLDIDGDKVTGGAFTIDMNSMTCTDLQGETAQKLLGHLKSDDFFGVAQHPTARLVITKAVWQGGNTYNIAADLTIKGITKPIKFPATVEATADAVTAKASIVVDRTEYNVRYGSGSFFDNLGDKTIYDNFTLDVNLVAKK